MEKYIYETKDYTQRNLCDVAESLLIFNCKSVAKEKI